MMITFHPQGEHYGANQMINVQLPGLHHFYFLSHVVIVAIVHSNKCFH